MTFFEKLFKQGELPTVTTAVTIDDSAIIKLALATLIVALIIILISHFINRNR